MKSLFLGDLEYPSVYRMGVAQASGLLGIEHRDLSLHNPAEVIDMEVRAFRPDVLWTHMLLWPPKGSPGVDDLLTMAVGWRRTFGTKVLVHDGDPRKPTRRPEDVSTAVDLALLNHNFDRSAWGVPAVYWPYASLTYHERGAVDPKFAAGLVFTGLLREGTMYEARTRCVEALRERLSSGPERPLWDAFRAYPEPGMENTRAQTLAVAASAGAVIGFGRPEVPGWIDTRVFQYPGAGAVLLHDDVHPEFTGLVPGEHYVQVQRYDVDSILDNLDFARRGGQAIRDKAFAHVQAHHTYVHRVRQVLDVLGLRPKGL